MRSKEFYQNLGYRDAIEYYRVTGWEDSGYLSPELSDDDTYPVYIQKEAIESAEKINSYLKENDCVSFGFMTDLHYATTHNHRIRMERMLSAYKEICKKTGNYTLLLGGDLTNEGCKEYKTGCFKELRKKLSGINYFPTNGNHDDGTIWDVAYIDNHTSENHLTQAERYELFYNHLENAYFPTDEKVLYYYADDEKTKTRYISLDTGDVPYLPSGGRLTHTGQWTFAMSQKQTDWLINKALKFTESGWGAVIFLHSMTPPPPIAEKCRRSKEKWYLNHIEDIADAFKSGKNLSQKYYDGDFELCVNANFSNSVKADIIAFFAGDFHCDMLDYTHGGIPKIFTGNSVTYRGGNDNPPRNDGDKSEMLFDMVVVDKSIKKIHITRVGCGNDRDVNY